MSSEGKEELGVLQVNVGSGKVFENVNKGKDMFVQISFNSQTKKTTTKKYTDKPTWDENFDIPVYEALEDNSILVFELYATDGSSDSVLGKGTVQKLKYFTNGEDMVFTLSLENLNITTGAGQLTVTVRPLGCAEPPEQNQNLSTPTVVVRDRSFGFPVEEPVVVKDRSFAFGAQPIAMLIAPAPVAVADSRAADPVSPRRAPKTMLIATNTKAATAPEPASARSGAVQATDALAAEPVSTYSEAIQPTDALAAEPVSAPSKPMLVTYTLAAAPVSALATDQRAAEPVSPRRAPIAAAAPVSPRRTDAPQPKQMLIATAAPVVQQQQQQQPTSPRSPRLKSARAQPVQAQTQAPAQGKQTRAQQPKTEHLLIMVRHAVITTKKTKLPNPYVKVGYSGAVFRTPILAQTDSPRWEEEFQFDFDANNMGSLQVEMYDCNTESADPDPFIGKAVGSIDTNYGDGLLHEHKLPLMDLNKQPVGMIVLCALKR